MRLAFFLLGAELFALDLAMPSAHDDAFEGGAGGQFELASDGSIDADAPDDRRRVGFARGGRQ